MYSMSVHYFDNRTPKEWLMFQKALSKVLISQNITTGSATYGMAQRLMEGATLSKFDGSALLHGAETLIHYKEVRGDITHYVFSYKSSIDPEVIHVSYGRHMRKAPYMLKMKEYMAHVERNSIIIYQCSLTTPIKTSYTKMMD
jgi:hypothetical protein